MYSFGINRHIKTSSSDIHSVGISVRIYSSPTIYYGLQPINGSY